MSLVNDMLRDLEQRNESTAHVPGQQSGVKAAQYVEESPASNAPRIALWLIGIVAVVTTCWLLWLETSTENRSSDSQVDSASSSLAATKGKDTARLTDTSGRVDTPDVSVAPDEKRAGKDVAAMGSMPVATAELTATVAISDIKWAGADFGGDLVVRLNGDADIQVLNQKDNVIVVAIDDVALKTTLPAITSDYINRLDIAEDADRNRTLLTLTTTRKSQFSFRVQTSPTTLILGVIPEEVSQPVKDITESGAVAKIEPSTPLKPLTVINVSPDKPSIRSGAELQVNMADASALNSAVVSKPVNKSTNALTDRQFSDRARRLITKGQREAAETLLTKGIAQNRLKAEQSRVLLSTLLLSKGETGAAQILIQQSRDLHPDNSDLKKLQARIWMAEGKADQAIDLLSTHAPLLSTDFEYHELLASAYQQVNNPEESARIYFQLLQSNNSTPRWWIGMGYALEQVKRYADARNAYQSALQIPTIDSRLKSYARQRINALSGR